jgi:hypothetical protein
VKNVTDNQVKRRILDTPKLREIYYEELKRSRQETIAREERASQADATKEERRNALWQRLGYDPIAADKRLKAKIQEREDHVAAQRREEYRRDLMFVEAMTNAARRRLKEIGIK